jgi:hypothetical protein
MAFVIRDFYTIVDPERKYRLTREISNDKYDRYFFIYPIKHQPQHSGHFWIKSSLNWNEQTQIAYVTVDFGDKYFAELQNITENQRNEVENIISTLLEAVLAFNLLIWRSAFSTGNTLVRVGADNITSYFGVKASIIEGRAVNLSPPN